MEHIRERFVACMLAGIISVLAVGCEKQAENYDWPMWRYDANRSASSPQQLPETLHLSWVCEYPKLSPTWDDPLNQDLMQFDKVYEPVVYGTTLFIGSNASDCLIAIDTETGQEKWKYRVDGPVRFPAVAANGKVYFVSDDGFLYCADAETGETVWTFQGTPSHRKILGNERLISNWPARGGPVLKEGVVYFCAGIWPFMGVFIYALDAETGNVIWENDSAGAKYMLQPHNSPAYAGVAPQGNLVVVGDKLLVPCGRSVPACFDLKTGELEYYHLAKHNKTGGAFVSAAGEFFVNYHRDSVVTLYDLETGDPIIRRFGRVPVITEKRLFSRGNPITAYDLANLREVVKDKQIDVDEKSGDVKTVQNKAWSLDTLWTVDVDGSGDLIQAGKRLYAGGKNVVSAIELPIAGRKPRVSWQASVEGTVERLIAAGGKLFAVTLEGRIYAFGGEAVTAPKFFARATPVAQSGEQDTAITAKAAAVLKATAVRDGYCLAYGLENGDLVEMLLRSSDLRIIAVDSDPAKVERLREQFDAAGLYGERFSIQVGDVSHFEAPPYLASLIVFETLDPNAYRNNGEFFQKIYTSLRPYSGVAYLPVSQAEVSGLARYIATLELPKARTGISNGVASEGYVLLIRDGSLPDAADWTHQYGDVANTVKSDDSLVKLPLGVLWFGGSSNLDVLPRHGHGPPEQIVGGRMFLQGIGTFSARDVYTGRVLWKRHLSRLDTYGVYYDKTYKDTPLDPAYNQVHIPGANARGTNYVATEDKLYIVLKESCLVLDPATGKTIDEFRLPSETTGGSSPEWGYIGVYKDFLIAGADFVQYLDFLELDELDPRLKDEPQPFYNYDITASKRLVVMNRHTGDVLWSRKAKLGFWHNAIAVGNDRIFCIDMLAPSVAEALKRRLGKFRFDPPELTAINISNGKGVWHTTEDVFGTWLSYSETHNVLLHAGRSSRDMIRGEPGGMAAYDAKNGDVLWRSDVSDGGPYMLHGERIITDRAAYSLLTGEREMRVDPLTGEETPWVFKRDHGCNYAIASEHLLTFRSAAAGFFDLARDGGTGNFGGFRSSCTSNLIAADGVLNAPDYTRTCSCSYQNQTSLALVHLPELEMWTTFHNTRKESAIARSNAGIAFADRDGNLLYVNDALLKMLGYSGDADILGKPLTALWGTPDEGESALATAQRRGDWSGSMLARKGDSETLQLHAMVNLINGTTNTRTVMMASFGDMKGGASAFLALDGHLTQVDEACMRLWNFGDSEEALHNSFGDLWQDKARAATAQQAWHKTGTWSGEMVAVADDGFLYDTFVATKVVRDKAGQPVSVAGTFIQLTERKGLIADATSFISELGAEQDIKHALTGGRPVRNVGINFGAPGDRRADNGTLWLEYPAVGGPSPEVKVAVAPEGYTAFSRHPSRVDGERLNWVLASGIKGASTVTITLGEAPSVQLRRYVVRLYFAEPDDLKPGQRRFNVGIQGEEVLTGFDIVEAAGGPRRPVVKEFVGILVESDLKITLTPTGDAETAQPVICGIEILAEES